MFLRGAPAEAGYQGVFLRTVLFILGIEDSNRVLMHTALPGPSYELHGSIDLHLDLHHPDIHKQVLVLGGVAGTVPAVKKPDVIFNCITDADSSSKALGMAMQVIRQHPEVPVINRPVHVLKTRRDDVAAALAGIPGLVVPDTVRITPDSHRDILAALAGVYPAIIRRIGTHGGDSMLLLRSPADAPLLERIACDGSSYYLIRFVDFRDEDGLYRKTRLVVVGNRVFARHQLAGDDWNVHASVRESVMAVRPGLLAAEERFLQEFAEQSFPLLAARLAAIRQRLRLDYFSIDCSLRPDGDLLLFEANASGNALRQPEIDRFPYLRRPVLQLREAVTRLLLEPS
jgi:glutathione synthase/RimK-type ligase-like ATP-grasp enzyme